MTFAKLTAVSMTAMMVGVSAANAEMILRKDAQDNKVIVNTDTEQEARIYGPGETSGERPETCETGNYYTMMDNDREVYVSCDDDKTMYSSAMHSTSSDGNMASKESQDEPLEPYAPGTEGTNN
ncbi:hypothetical protein [Afifella sp. H1R]|uniref:hypothetical protein n=1 Tax=unclassified Afifella TaxID=2624128 RepID=UPI001F365435|nr:hypothetical protein [Afifella sp. H1R]MCF1505404.1 hypothetical protein [Afifella sp. H1R]